MRAVGTAKENARRLAAAAAARAPPAPPAPLRAALGALLLLLLPTRLSSLVLVLAVRLAAPPVARAPAGPGRILLAAAAAPPRRRRGKLELELGDHIFHGRPFDDLHQRLAGRVDVFLPTSDHEPDPIFGRLRWNLLDLLVVVLISLALGGGLVLATPWILEVVVVDIFIR